MSSTTAPRTAPAAAASLEGPLPPTPGQHSLGRSLLLHLLPGALFVVFLLLAAPVAESGGLPGIFAMFIGIGVVLVPFELGYLMVHARRTTGSWSPLAAVDYRAKLPLRRLVLLGAALAGWFLVFLGASMVFFDRWLSETLFAWLPAALLDFSDVGGDPLPGGALVLVLVVAFTLNGVLGPVTEELYFRGHLLPRIDRFGRWAPVLNTVLFALYHLHTPWRYPAILLGFLPASWTVWRTRSVYLGMVAHVVVNNLFLLLLLAAYLEAAA